MLVNRYEACMDVTDSDHKPVRCIFNVEVARVDESIRRQEFGEIFKSNVKIRRSIEELSRIPEAIVSTNNIILQNQDTSILRITNKCKKDRAIFELWCEGVSAIKEDKQASGHHPRGCFGFPQWLEVILYSLFTYCICYCSLSYRRSSVSFYVSDISRLISFGIKVYDQAVTSKV